MNQGGMPPQQQQAMGQVRPMGNMLGQRMGTPSTLNQHQNFMG
jgi:hypothetical protein